MNSKANDHVDKLITNIQMTASKCFAYGLTKVFVSGVTISNRLSVDVVKSVNNKIVIWVFKIVKQF